MWAVIAWGKVHGGKSNYSRDISSFPQAQSSLTAIAGVWYESRSERALIWHTSRCAEEGHWWFGCVRQEAWVSSSGVSSQSVGHISPTTLPLSIIHTSPTGDECRSSLCERVQRCHPHKDVQPFIFIPDIPSLRAQMRTSPSSRVLGAGVELNGK